MSQFKPYPAYKASGIDWLGEIPEHWQITKGKWEWKKQSRPIRETDEIVTAFRDGQVTLRKNRREDGFTIAALEHGYQGIRKGDLVIHGMDAFAGAIGVSDSNGKSSPVYSACTPRKESNPFYFAYLLKEMSDKGWIEALAKGIRERSTEFKFPQFSELRYPIPSLVEQTAIAKFLDYKTAQIDEFIALKEKTIALLKERKAAIINHAVTKGLPAEERKKAGLDPNVPMKVSGVDWLGEVPAHWEVKKLKYLTKYIQTGRTPSSKEFDYFEKGEIDWFTPGDFKTIELKDSTRKVANMALKNNEIQIYDGGNLYLIGIGATLGKVGICYTMASANQQVNVVKLIESRLEGLFGAFQLMLIGRELIHWVNYTTMPIFNQSQQKELLLAVPPLSEQSVLVTYIQYQVDGVDQSISQAQEEISLIKEYRQSLISEAVTGKIDVRGWQAATKAYAERQEEALLMAAEPENTYNQKT